MSSGEPRDLAVASSGDTASKLTLLFFRVLIVYKKTTARHESSPLSQEINATISQIADFLVVKTHSTAVM